MVGGKKRKIKDFLTYAVLILFACIFTLPTAAMVGTAFKGDTRALSDTGLFPTRPELTAFRAVLQSDFLLSALNSLKIGLIVTCLCIILAVLAGYALSRYKSRMLGGFQIGLLVLQMFPLMLMLMPLFMIYKKINVIDTHWSLILSYTSLNLPFSIWMLKGFFDTIPYELEESGFIDGCSPAQCLLRLVLPVAMTGIATVAIFTFLNVWNEYTFSNIFVTSQDKITLTVGLQKYVSKNLNSWGQMMAASTLGIIPSILFLLFAQKHIVQGMTSGAVKG